MAATVRMTPKQKLLLRHFRQGLSHKEIACNMGISTSTVAVHLCNIRQKIGKNADTDVRLLRWCEKNLSL